MLDNTHLAVANTQRRVEAAQTALQVTATLLENGGEVGGVDTPGTS